MITGRSQNTYENYAQHLSKLALHFNEIPTNIPPKQINDYLFHLSIQKNTPSNSYFKFAVYSLRKAYNILGMTEKIIHLPSIKRPKKLPVVLSKNEMKRMLEHPKIIKHRVLIGLVYGCGLRSSEVRNVKISDLDFDRNTLLVRQGKSKKDRYTPLSSILIEQIKQYLMEDKPTTWLFNGKGTYHDTTGFDNRYSTTAIQLVVKQTAKRSDILKPVSVHTLRHTFATHLLEDGLDIVSIKDLLGHSRIDATMVYLHVAQYHKPLAFSPLDTLYKEPKSAHQFKCPFA